MDNTNQGHGFFLTMLLGLLALSMNWYMLSALFIITGVIVQITLWTQQLAAKKETTIK
ncbi:hypothetical protein [Enterococcus timonensis]|uniref:hypothetical protein n=1 Tax=Enterococcus timonensis TaxID=1852364 RepID=UPI001319F115|nr:hypothetical protein [Enterococcus timonensis]